MTAYLTLRYDPQLVALSMLLAAFTGYVALELSGRMADKTPRAWRWLLAGAPAMGTGLWATHFLCLLALDLSMPLSYAWQPLLASWGIAVVAAALALRIAGSTALAPLRWAGGALALGAATALMHRVAMSALRMQPEIEWNPWLAAGAGVLAVAGAGAMLWTFFYLRRYAPAGRLMPQALAALLGAAALMGMHYTGLAAVSVPTEAILLDTSEISRPWLGATVSLAALAVLLVAGAVAVLDARVQRHTEGLMQSLAAADLELKSIALQDPLTRLANRRRFEENLRRACASATQYKHKAAVLFMGLDGFKAINDVFGHRTGDEVLRAVGRRLAEDLRGSDTVARLGGDEFVILLERLEHRETAEALARRVLRTVSAPLGLADREIALSASVGIAFFPDDGDYDRLIANADIAMHSAKDAGRATYRFYSPEMDAGVRDSLMLQRDLRRALENDEFELAYQAKVDARTGMPTSTEALIRWNHPERGRVNPADFIPIAEKSGLIVAIGNWVIQRAVAQVAAWQAQGLRIPVAVNLSGQHFQDPQLPATIERALAEHGVAPTMLTLEITETAAMSDAEETLRVLASLANIGVHISIDDFGTGYSSLAYLRRFHAFQIKIDRSFVADIEESEDARSVIQAVINLAHALQRRVVAEGVETAAQALYLKQHGCDELQGFLFSRPGPVDVISRFFTEPARRVVA